MIDGRDPSRPITLGDLVMPGGWAVSAGQTHLYTADELRLVAETRAFAQKTLPVECGGNGRGVTAGCTISAYAGSSTRK